MTVYAIVPTRYRYKGRHRKAEPFSHRVARSAAGLALTVIWLSFGTVGAVTTVWPR